MTKLAILLSVALVAGLAARADAACTGSDESLCGSVCGKLMTYKQIDDPDPDDSRASTVDGDFQVRLRGWWFKPTSPQPTKGYPTIIYNHGSEENPGDKCAIVGPLLAEGFAVFVPHRRGHGRSTGIYYEDWRDQQTQGTCAIDPSNCSYYKRTITMDYLHRQANDVAAAYRHIAGFPAVNANKMSLMGHSFGGMVTLFTNEQELGQKATIAIAPGGESWDGDPCIPDGNVSLLCFPWSLRGGVLQSYLYNAVDDARAPVFFFDTKNDVSVAPIYELSYYGWKTYLDRFQAALYTPIDGLTCAVRNSDGNLVTCGKDEPQKLCPYDPVKDEQKKCGELAHGAFVTDPTQVAKWIPTVVDFIGRFNGN